MVDRFYRGHLQGNYDKCIEDCNEAIRLNPKDSCAYQNRGAALGMKDRFDDSITDSTRAIELASTARAWPFINRAMARAGKGNYESAIRDLESALDVEPNNQYANVWLAYHLAACLDEHSRDAKRAKNTAITACELSNWNDTPSLDVLGMAYAEASEFEKAIEYAEKALSIAATFQNSASLQQQLRRRIELYRNGRAYHGNVRKWAIEYAGLADDLGRIYRPQNFSNSD